MNPDWEAKIRIFEYLQNMNVHRVKVGFYEMRLMIEKSTLGTLVHFSSLFSLSIRMTVSITSDASELLTTTASAPASRARLRVSG